MNTKGIIRGAIIRSGNTTKGIARKTGIPLRTIQKRLSTPSSIRLDELSLIAKSAELRDEEIVEIVRGLYEQRNT